MSGFSQADIERFWSKVDKERSTIFYNGTRCWEWIGSLTHNGYGRFAITHTKTLRAHRVSYEITFGNIPGDLDVLHHCDNPTCVNQAHLFSGTPQDNMDDKVRKGRQPIGETHGGNKLSEKQVYEIRRRYKFWGKGGDTSTALAKEFGVGQALISSIVRGKSWKRITGAHKKRARLSDKDISEIRRRYSFWGINGDDSVTLAKEFGVDAKTIRNIANYKTRK